ncbi:MAG TPA: heparan-alpha-glucosaminide N-acetyltransferase domain-containing protein [Bacteroidota bacterium]|nr:heparan-alpha-glucosaminide N-acetyltransferase domain-containing protein [Bacteroidota bacterium]
MTTVLQEQVNHESRARRGIFYRLAPQGKPGRLQFIDAFRGWAVLVMIETHVLNSTLRPDLTEGPLYKVLNFINGLVAPAFLFAAGLTFAIATRRKLRDYLAYRPALFKQLGRIALLFVIGYCLHIPKFEYHHLRYETGTIAWHNFLQVDILQCIGMTLLLLTALLLVLRTERKLYIASSILLGGVLLATPLIWQVDFWTILPIPLAEYFNGNHVSMFPLLPWSAFVLAGTLVGYYYLESAGPGLDPALMKKRMTTLSLFAVGLILASFVLHPIAASLYPSYDYWKTSPSFVLLRLGLVILLLAGGYFWEQRRGISASSVVTISGRESLLVYTVHLMILYGNFKGPHFVDRVGHQFGFLEVFGVSAVLIVLMILLAVAWSFIKSHHIWLRRSIEGCVVAGFAYVFFVGL